MFNKKSKLFLLVLLSILFTCVLCINQDIPMPKAIVDLSPVMGEDFVVKTFGEQASQGIEDFKFEHIITEKPYYSAISYIRMINHVGPHYDPPAHIIKDGKTVDQVPLERFYGKAKVFDFRAKRKDEPLLKSDFEDKNIQVGDVVIVFVGYTTPEKADEMPSYAFLSGEAAEYLASIPIKAFATDMPSIASIKRFLELSARGVTGTENFFPEHYAFLSREIPNFEGLVNLESIVNKQDIIFVGFPLKFKGGNGSPIRAAALIY